MAGVVHPMNMPLPNTKVGEDGKLYHKYCTLYGDVKCEMSQLV